MCSPHPALDDWLSLVCYSLRKDLRTQPISHEYLSGWGNLSGEIISIKRHYPSLIWERSNIKFHVIPLLTTNDFTSPDLNDLKLSAHYKTTDHRQAIDYQKLTTDPPTGPPLTQRSPRTNHWSTDRSSTDPQTTNNWPPTYRLVFNQPINHRTPTHQPTDHIRTDPPTTDPPTILEPTHQPPTPNPPTIDPPTTNEIKHKVF